MRKRHRKHLSIVGAKDLCRSEPRKRTSNANVLTYTFNFVKKLFHSGMNLLKTNKRISIKLKKRRKRVSFQLEQKILGRKFKIKKIKAEFILFSKGDDLKVFPCFNEQDLKIQPVFKRFIINLHIDDDIDSDDETVIKGIKYCFNDLK